LLEALRGVDRETLLEVLEELLSGVSGSSQTWRNSDLTEAYTTTKR